MTTLKEKIREKGITARHVARMVNIHYATLSKIINGKQLSRDGSKTYVSDKLMHKINAYLDELNTDPKIN